MSAPLSGWLTSSPRRLNWMEPVPFSIMPPITTRAAGCPGRKKPACRMPSASNTWIRWRPRGTSATTMRPSSATSKPVGSITRPSSWPMLMMRWAVLRSASRGTRRARAGRRRSTRRSVPAEIRSGPRTCPRRARGSPPSDVRISTRSAASRAGCTATSHAGEQSDKRRDARYHLRPFPLSVARRLWPWPYLPWRTGRAGPDTPSSGTSPGCRWCWAASGSSA